MKLTIAVNRLKISAHKTEIEKEASSEVGF